MDTTTRLTLELLRRITTNREAMVIWLIVGLVLFGVAYANRNHWQLTPNPTTL